MDNKSDSECYEQIDGQMYQLCDDAVKTISGNTQNKATAKWRKPQIVARYQIAVSSDGVRMKMVTIVELENGQRMSLADYRKL
jgi:hypothetical protein